MRLAVSYDNGTIFQHFGKSEQFKVYEIDNKQVVSTEIISPDAGGHDALASFLDENGVDAVICGGMGQGAQNALTEVGIEIFAGNEGSADEAVEAFLRGDLFPGGASCDHHEEGGSCGGDCSGGGCAGCGGGCGGGMRLTMEGKNAGKKVRAHYRGTFNDGTQFDSSYDRGEPLEFICAAGMMISGFDKAVVNMEVGEVVDVHLMPEEAYGMPDPNAIFTVEIAKLPGSEALEVGQQVYLANAMGQPFPVVVTAKDDVNITLDANSEMAGKELNFHIELVSVED